MDNTLINAEMSKDRQSGRPSVKSFLVILVEVRLDFNRQTVNKSTSVWLAAFSVHVRTSLLYLISRFGFDFAKLKISKGLNNIVVILVIEQAFPYDLIKG